MNTLSVLLKVDTSDIVMISHVLHEYVEHMKDAN